VELFLPFVAVFLPLLLGASFVIGRHWRRGRVDAPELSAVTRQHLELLEGIPLNRAAVEAARRRLRAQLRSGKLSRVEADLRSGTHYAIDVQALEDIATDDAARILQKQLERRRTEDAVEQSWYWIDVCSALRRMNHWESLPHVLGRVETANVGPLGFLFASEAARFQGFHEYLREPQSQLGRLALRGLHRVFEGLCHGIDQDIVSEARLGEALELVWDHRQDKSDPLVARVFVEVIRFLTRCRGIERPDDEESERWQISRMRALESDLLDFLKEAPPLLIPRLSHTAIKDHPDLLSALDDLRAEAADVLLPLLADGGYPHACLAIDVLRWSRDPRVGPWLRDRASRWVRQRRAPWAPHQTAPLAPDVVAGPCYLSVLRALRHHPSSETERFLIAAAGHRDPGCRAAALGSLGWSEPLEPAAISAALGQGRSDPDSDVRRAARGALARLGDRESLQSFRVGLSGNELLEVCRCIEEIGNEGLVLLWPDLDRLTNGPDPEVSQMAWDAIERLDDTVSGR
jgi:hypothetical protein